MDIKSVEESSTVTESENTRNDERLSNNERATYLASVNGLADRKEDFTFKNNNAHKGAIVLEAMLTHAEKEMYIYDENLTGDLAKLEPSFYDSLKLFAKKPSNTLKIILKSDGVIDRKSKIYEELSSLHSSYPLQVQVFQASEDFTAFIVQKLPYNPNFAIADDCMYRLETDDGGRRAFCNFNDEEIATKLKGLLTQKIDTCLNLFNQTTNEPQQL